MSGISPGRWTHEVNQAFRVALIASGVGFDKVHGDRLSSSTFVYGAKDRARVESALKSAGLEHEIAASGTVDGVTRYRVSVDYIANGADRTFVPSRGSPHRLNPDGFWTPGPKMNPSDGRPFRNRLPRPAKPRAMKGATIRVCPSCLRWIGGAYGEPDAPWRPCRTEEECDVRNHSELTRRNPSAESDRIDRFRRIVERCQAEKIDGLLVDLFSASAIVQVYDALSGANRSKFARMPVERMVEVAFKLLNDPKVSRKNPGLGMPGFPHTWVTKDGSHVQAGDVVEYWKRVGGHHDRKRERKKAKVSRYLVFDDHVVTSGSTFGDVVDDSNFIRVARKADRSRSNPSGYKTGYSDRFTVRAMSLREVRNALLDRVRLFSRPTNRVFMYQYDPRMGCYVSRNGQQDYIVTETGDHWKSHRIHGVDATAEKLCQLLGVRATRPNPSRRCSCRGGCRCSSRANPVLSIISNPTKPKYQIRVYLSRDRYFTAEVPESIFGPRKGTYWVGRTNSASFDRSQRHRWARQNAYMDQHFQGWTEWEHLSGARPNPKGTEIRRVFPGGPYGRATIFGALDVGDWFRLPGSALLYVKMGPDRSSQAYMQGGVIHHVRGGAIDPSRAVFSAESRTNPRARRRRRR